MNLYTNFISLLIFYSFYFKICYLYIIKLYLEQDKEEENKVINLTSIMGGICSLIE